MSSKQSHIFTWLMGIFVIGILLIGVSLYAINNNPFPSHSTTTTVASSTVGQVNCLPNTLQTTKFLMSPYSGDSALLQPQWNRFTQNAAGQLVQVSDSPGILTSGTASALSTNPYSIGPPSNTFEQLKQSGEDGVYPAWYQVNSNSLTSPVTQYGNNVFQVACNPSSSNSASYNWAMTGVLFQSPTTSNSSTTYISAAIQYPAGTPTAFPTSATTWNINLNINSAYKTAMQAFPECGTSANPVYNYATGTEYFGCPSGPGQGGLPTVQGYLIIVANRTGLALSANGLIPLKSPALPSGDLAWAVPVAGCAPAPGSGVSSTSPYLCAQVPVQVTETVTPGTPSASAGVHGEIVFWFVDMQQAAYLNNYITAPAQAGSWATGSAAGTQGAGTPTGISGLTVTSGQNAGNPGPLVEQYIAVLLTY